MNASELIHRLQANARVLEDVIRGTPEEMAVWRPAPDKWSIVEVCAHLFDEEREDFRVRLDLTLHQPEAEWPSINPAAWVVERAYAERNLRVTLQAFMGERTRSIEWLEGLRHPAWETTHTHPQLGSISAGDLLAAWVAHDFLHLRQLARIHWEHVRHLAQPFDVGYAGDW